MSFDLKFQNNTIPLVTTSELYQDFLGHIDIIPTRAAIDSSKIEYSDSNNTCVDEITDWTTGDGSTCNLMGVKICPSGDNSRSPVFAILYFNFIPNSCEKNDRWWRINLTNALLGKWYPDKFDLAQSDNGKVVVQATPRRNKLGGFPPVLATYGYIGEVTHERKTYNNLYACVGLDHHFDKSDSFSVDMTVYLYYQTY